MTYGNVFKTRLTSTTFAAAVYHERILWIRLRVVGGSYMPIPMAIRTHGRHSGGAAVVSK
jgi:hypothetical protein